MQSLYRGGCSCLGLGELASAVGISANEGAAEDVLDDLEEGPSASRRDLLTALIGRKGHSMGKNALGDSHDRRKVGAGRYGHLSMKIIMQRSSSDFTCPRPDKFASIVSTGGV